MAADDSIRLHLESLIGETDIDKLTAGNPAGFSEWTNLNVQIYKNNQEDVDVKDNEILLVEGVISVYSEFGYTQGSRSSASGHRILDDSLWDSFDRSVWQAVLNVLSSSASEDEVSEDLAENFGYERLDLVSEILPHRQEFIQEIEGRLHSDASSTRKSHSAEQLFSDARSRMEASFQAKASRPLFTGGFTDPQLQSATEQLPHVYTSQSFASGGSMLSQFGSKYSLPLGTTRTLHEEYEEFVIPPARAVPPRTTERQITIEELDPLAKGCFSAYRSLNRIQSIVYPVAYRTNENMLVCGKVLRGKTDVALLSILRVLNLYRDPDRNLRDSIRRNAFKIIYVAPMKALASEITRKFSKRLRWLSIVVRELTGDMQMSKSEIAETQVIVTTPEKWDVVTRKPTGEGELASSIKLLILDEIHLLNESRGAVLETIVARTLRQVESSQTVVRIVGLSATLPNYVDVAQFLSVSPQKGLFFFDSSFRPVPLEQHFIGIKGKSGSALSKKNMDTVTFKKVAELVEQGHQVMVFVHSRKETAKTAMYLREMSIAEGNSDAFLCDEHPQWSQFRTEVGKSRNKEMKFLFDNGFGIHHAGLLRSDRNIMERLFESRAIKVLCCTATLAWGVNLPAHAVIIKGTQVYDSSRGAMTDLSVLDVLQIFGRAGRPGLESSGEGYICTTDDKLHHYLEAANSSLPIESRFQSGMIDALNAEISLGTVSNCSDAVQWLGYTYLYVRMRKNPYLYGIDGNALADDPGLGNKRNELIRVAARRLAELKMIIFDEGIEIFNTEFRPIMSEADVLRMLSQSTEFDQIQLREAEMDELEELLKGCPCEVGLSKAPATMNARKVNILLQSYISRINTINESALISDMAYVAQNSGRIIRALLEISISKKWANVTLTMVGMSKAVEKRMWPYEHPLEQSQLKLETLGALRRWADEVPVEELVETDPEALGKLIHLNEFQGLAISNAAKQFPSARFTYRLQPLANDILKVSLVVSRNFSWNSRIHGTTEPFWVWIEDEGGVNIFQLAHLAFHQQTQSLDVDFILPISGSDAPPSLVIRWVSDHWIGAEYHMEIPLDGVVMPPPPSCHSPLLDLPFLSVDKVLDPAIAQYYSGNLSHLNITQTQVFWTIMHSREHALFCSPGGSGKTVLIEMLLQTLMVKDRPWIIVLAPKRSILQALQADLRSSAQGVKFDIEFPEAHKLLRYKERSIFLATPATLLSALSLQPASLSITKLDLVVCDHLEQLDPGYELSVSTLRFATQASPTRFIGISDSLNNPADLADWINVEPTSLFSFRPREREQSLKVHGHPFTLPHSAALFKTMAKPAYQAIASTLSTECALVFVPSKAQCRPIALDLITQSALHSESARGYLPQHVSEEMAQIYRDQLQDQDLGDFIAKGVGFYYHGIHKRDRSLILQLYVEGVVRVLLAPKDACWDIPARSSVVVVLGTQYVEVEPESNARRIRDYTLTDIVRMQSLAISHAGNGQFHLFCQAEQLGTYLRFLNEGLPLESRLLEFNQLRNWISKLQSNRKTLTRQELFDILSFTFLSRRISSNPTYYGFDSGYSRDEKLSQIVDQLLNDDNNQTSQS
ncbi:activating signal cointegrator 1 complex subunit 3 [Coprinopsis marcescibilis]|uniref:Activating signal cointegrator 1 complex subunit 3 n=1 Tax=Coprinopsis marcescibilis TaxID=230819 RepID=A0A5C3L9J4_COPMA|nr:activating signal cointegrator 1 complex subunit 3 [Coprinopsis marcescibilis]